MCRSVQSGGSAVPWLTVSSAAVLRLAAGRRCGRPAAGGQEASCSGEREEERCLQLTLASCWVSENVALLIFFWSFSCSGDAEPELRASPPTL